MGSSAQTPLLPRHLAERVLAGRAELEGERKTVTVMFADLVGSTVLGDRLDPEDVVDILNGVFELWVDAVHRYEGMVDKFLGDGMLALFGAPLALEDHARRAVLAGLELRDATRAYATTLGDFDLSVRVGLNTGTVVVGAVGSDARMEYTAIGDTVNVAQRVESSAQPGTIYVTEATRRQVEAYFEIDAAGSFALKGKREPFELFEVRADKGVTGVVRGVEGMRSSVVGRTSERARLELLLDELGSGRGNSLAMVGDAGVGKSRLLAETRARASERGLRWAEGQAVSFGSTTPYLLIRQIVHQIEPSAVTELFDRSSHVEPGARHRHVVSAVRRLVVEHGPLVVALDDIHWADAVSLDVTSVLCRAARDHPVLVLANSRPDAVDTLAGLGFEALQLGSLDPDDSLALARNYLDIERIPDALRDEVLGRAEGNPFFLEELLRGLIDAGVLERRSGGWEAVRDATGIPLPERVEDLIASRIDRLPADAKRVLQGASVIGRTFDEAVLSRVAGGGLAALPVLRDRGFLLAGSVPGEHRFTHVLTQEAAYAGMLKKVRRRLHQRAGEAIEVLYPQERERRAPELATHFDRAGAVAKATEYLHLAARNAIAEYANAAALTLLGRALELVDDPMTRFEMLALRAEVLLRIGHPDDASIDAGQMLRIANDLGDPDLELTALVMEAESAVHSDYLEAAPPIERALDLAEQLDAPAARGRVLRLQAMHEMSQYAPGRAASALSEALTLLEHEGLEAEWAAALGEMSRAKVATDPNDAARWAERALAAARSLGDPGMVGPALARVAQIELDEGRCDEARAQLGEAERIAIEIGSADLECLCSQMFCYVHAVSGERERADERFAHTLELTRRTGNEWSWLLTVMAMVEVWETQERWGALLEWLRSGFGEVEARGHPHNTAYFHYAIGYRALRWLGAYEEALDEVALAVVMVDQGEFQPPRIMFRNGAAAILADLGRIAEARAMLTDGFAVAEAHSAMDVTGAYLHVTDARLSMAEGDLVRAGAAAENVEALGAIATGWMRAGERLAAAVLRAQIALASGEPGEARRYADLAVAGEPIPWAATRWFSTLEVLELAARTTPPGRTASRAWAAARDEAVLRLAEVPVRYRDAFSSRAEVRRVLRAGS